ncbi:MAG: hypothetical protein NVS3B26_29210 [Mycobacteriales bacterium]
MLTAVHVPKPQIEAVLDLARARTDLDDDLKRVRRRLLSFLLRYGHVYRAGSTWTQAHHQWLDALWLGERAEQQTFDYYRSVMAIRERELAAICTDLRGWLDQPPLQDTAHRLAAYHAVGYLGGLSIAAEGAEDWQRFASARSFIAYTGLIPSEHSTGNSHRRGAITKAGNKVIRTQLIESARHHRGRPIAGKTLQPFMPSSRMSRSTVCLLMSGKPLRPSQAVIFRRPYSTSGSGRPSGPPVRTCRSRSSSRASLRARADACAVFHAR